MFHHFYVPRWGYTPCSSTQLGEATTAQPKKPVSCLARTYSTWPPWRGFLLARWGRSSPVKWVYVQMWSTPNLCQVSYIHTYTHTYIHAYIHTHIHTHIHTRTYVKYTYTSMIICISVKYICIYRVCIYIYIHHHFMLVDVCCVHCNMRYGQNSGRPVGRVLVQTLCSDRTSKSDSYSL